MSTNITLYTKNSTISKGIAKILKDMDELSIQSEIAKQALRRLEPMGFDTSPHPGSG